MEATEELFICMYGKDGQGRTIDFFISIKPVLQWTKHFVLSESNNLTIGPRMPVEIWRIKLCTKIHVIYKKKIDKYRSTRH
jgi:hypothetical protein